MSARTWRGAVAGLLVPGIVGVALALGVACGGDAAGPGGTGGGGDAAVDTAGADATDAAQAVDGDGDGGATQLDADVLGRVELPFDRCDDLSPEACFAARRDPSSEQVALALAIAHTQMDAHPAESLGWDWGEAVLLWSFAQLHAVTGDAALLDYIRAYMDHHLDEGWQIQTSDSCSPAAIAAFLVGATGDARYQPVVDDALDYLAHRALRTEAGAISHMGVIPVVTVWADSLFMFGNVWLAWWQASGDPGARDGLAEQLRLFADALQDPGGLYRHAAFWVVEPPEPVHWARGNGWAAAAAAQYLYTLTMPGQVAPGPAGEVQSLDDLQEHIETFQTQIGAVAAAQDADTGLWWNFVDHPGEMYRETSGTALFAYAMARAWRAGKLDDAVLPVVARAAAGVRGRIVERHGHPVVTGTSGPTTADLPETYAKVPLVDDISYGVGAVILALVETSGLPLPPVTAALDPVPAPPEEPEEVWEPVTDWQPSDAFLGRRETYLQACHDASGPGSGSLYGQVCRVAKGAEVDVAAIQEALAKVALRGDTSDFRVAALVRLLKLDDGTHALPAELRAAVEAGVQGFRFWLDQPGDDKMCFWSENHQILFHSSELVAGERFPDVVFPNAGMTGAEHAAHARPRILRWLDRRLRLGFSEWHSNVYFNEDMPALVNLADFAADPEIRERAAMVLDVMALDLLGNTFHGLFATAHGRTYEGHLVGGLDDSTQEAAWVMLGLGDMGSSANFSAAFLATSQGWAPPPVLETVAVDATGPFEHRQRDGIDVVDGPEHGIGYTEPDDVVFWAGMAALAESHVVDGTALLLDTYDLWGGFLFGDLPDSILSMLVPLEGTPSLSALAADLDVITRGIALESMNTYAYRTDAWQLAGAQDYNPGLWGAQTHVWQATLDADAYVFTSAPANLGDLLGSSTVELATGWVGGFLPRVTLYRGVGVIQYRPASVPGLDDDLSTGALHAYFPRAAFDEVREEGAWVFGRKGDAYVALGSENPMKQGAEDWELVVDTTVNAFVVELSSAAESGSFDAFVASVVGATLQVGEGGVAYTSPSVGLVQVGWEGPMTVAGQPVDLGPYDRWDNAFVHADFAATVTTVQRDGERLVLDGETGTRTVWTRVDAGE